MVLSVCVTCCMCVQCLQVSVWRGAGLICVEVLPKIGCVAAMFPRNVTEFRGNTEAWKIRPKLNVSNVL